MAPCPSASSPHEPAASGPPRSCAFEIPSDLRCVEGAVQRIMDSAGPWTGPRCRRMQVACRVALTEAITNAIRHGNDEDPRKLVRIDVTRSSTSIRVVVADEGGGFARESVPDPTREENLRGEGGRGLHLMRALMDDVRYNEQGNTVTLEFALR